MALPANLTHPWVDPLGGSKPKTKKKVGAFDPYGALQTQIDMITELAANGPDLSGLREEASRQAGAAIAPVEAQFGELRDSLQRNKANSQAAAQAFMEAMTGILQGGKTGQEGMDYARENYGGSYLGVIAAQMGQQLFSQITRDFDKQDFALVTQLGEVLAKRPDLENEIYNDLVKSTQDTFDNRIKYMAWNVSQTMKLLSDKSIDEDRRRKGVIDLMKATKGTAKAPYPVQVGNGWVYEYDPNSGSLTLLREGEGPQPTLRLNSAGQLVTVEGGVATVVGGANPARPTKTSEKAKPDFYDVREEARDWLASALQSKSPPDVWTAASELWAQYGNQLLAAGYPRKRVQTMITELLRRAGFDPSLTGPPSPSKKGKSSKAPGGYNW